MPSFSPLTPKIVLGVGAHPDDLDVVAGGTLAHFAAAGADVHYLILTDGSKGSEDPSMTPDALKEIRHAEQQAGLEAVGGKTITFLDYPDGELEVTLQLKKEIVKVIRTIKPDVVITMDPTVIYSAEKGVVNHPDHRAAGQATLDAIFPLARDRLAFPELETEGYHPHKTSTVLLANFNTTNFSVDVTDSFEAKARALMAHPSQFSDDSVVTWLRDMAKAEGAKAGYELAESFMRVDIR